MTKQEWIIRAKKLQRIQWQLSKGFQPEALGKRIGAGVQKPAYLVDGWIVKQNTGGFCHGDSHKMPKALLKIGLKPCRTYLGTKDWVIQEPCFVFRDYKNQLDKHKIDPELLAKGQAIIRANQQGKAGEMYDIHGGNIGIHEDGYFVCFDW